MTWPTTTGRGWIPYGFPIALTRLMASARCFSCCASLGLVVHVGWARARDRAPSSPSSAAHVTAGAVLRSVPLVLLWAVFVVWLLSTPATAGSIAATIDAATTVGVVAQMLRQLSQDGKRGERMPA